jgi:DNA mismatch repair enzyme (predicted ATPase)
LIRIVSSIVETTLQQNELAPKVTADEAKKIASKSFSDFVPQKTATDKQSADKQPISESKTESKAESKTESPAEKSSNQAADAKSVRESPASYSVPPAEPQKSFEKPVFLGSSKPESGYVAPAKDTEKRLKATERLLSKTNQNSVDSTNDSAKNSASPAEISLLDNIRVVGQISNLYILVEKDGGLLIIDQHAAHERIFYDIIKKQESNSIQELISPVVINLTPREKALMDEYIPYLEEVGFGVSEFGDCSYANIFRIWKKSDSVFPSLAIVLTQSVLFRLFSAAWKMFRRFTILFRICFLSGKLKAKPAFARQLQNERLAEPQLKPARHAIWIK